MVVMSARIVGGTPNIGIQAKAYFLDIGGQFGLADGWRSWVRK